MKTTKNRDRARRRSSSPEKRRRSLKVLPAEPEPPLEAPEPAPPEIGSRPGTAPGAIPRLVELAAELRKQVQHPRVRRILVPLLIGGAALALAAPIGLWALYRYGYVISRNALVKGHIADVGTRVDGAVSSVLVDAGDRVRADQIVARLDERHLQATVERARSKLEKASLELEVEGLAIANERRRLQSAVAEASARLAAAEAQVEAARSRADEARRQHQLQKGLAEKGFIANEQVRDTESASRTADALVAAAEAERRATEAVRHSTQVESEGLAVREERVAVLDSEVATFRAELEAAEADLEGTVIRAPGDGAVVRRIVQPGGSVVVGQPIIALWIGEELWVEAWIDEDDLSQVEVGNQARVSLQTHPDRVFSGTVESIGASTDFEMPFTEVPQPRNERMRGTPVVGVRVRLEEPAEGLFPGLSAVVAIRKKAR